MGACGYLVCMLTSHALAAKTFVVRVKVVGGETIRGKPDNSCFFFMFFFQSLGEQKRWNTYGLY